ncbi:MAG: hypothetical protein JXQ90_21650 [Cyclobacteriaceae bacterium]
MMRIVSYLFHPLLMASYVFIVLQNFAPEVFIQIPESEISTVLLITFFTTALVPAGSIVLLRLTSRITSLDIADRKERLFPFTTILIYYATSSYFFITILPIPVVNVMMAAVTLLILILLIITIKKKISIHSAGIWGATGMLVALEVLGIGDLMYPICTGFIMAGLVSTARLSQSLHSPRQIWSGAALGFSICFLGVLLFG